MLYKIWVIYNLTSGTFMESHHASLLIVTVEYVHQVWAYNEWAHSRWCVQKQGLYLHVTDGDF